MPSRRASKFKQQRRVLGIVVAILLLIIGIGLWRHPVKQTTAQYPAGVVTKSTNSPSEVPIKKGAYKSKAGPDEPKYISLPTITTEGYIEKVGVDQNKQVAVPTSIYLAGWFVDTQKPGQAGLSIIDGHVDGYKYDGIFKKLEGIKVGENFDVTRGDNKVLHYTVRTVSTVDTDKAAAVLFSQDPKIKSQLNLITCGGTFNKAKKQCDKRVIVAAELSK